MDLIVDIKKKTEDEMAGLNKSGFEKSICTHGEGEGGADKAG